MITVILFFSFYFTPVNNEFKVIGCIQCSKVVKKDFMGRSRPIGIIWTSLYKVGHQTVVAIPYFALGPKSM